MTASKNPTARARQRGTANDTAHPTTKRNAAPESEVNGHRSADTDDATLCQRLVDNVRDYAIFVLDPQGHVLTWNAGAERITSYKADEIIGRHVSVFYPPEDIAARKPDDELVIAAREGRFENEGWRLRKDGSYFWANAIVTALRDETGALVGFGKVTRDLTERRLAEETLRASEQQFRLLVGGVRDYAIFMLDPEGRIASWNAGAEAIKGWSANEIIGRHFSAFYPAEDVAAGKPKWELEIAVREGKYEEEGWRVRKDGSFFWANVLITAVRNPQNELIGFSKVTRDLTERRSAQQRALADARRLAEAEASNRTKSEFLTAMSHELRTPINATLGYAQLLETEIGGPITEQQREYLTRLRASQQHLLRIVNDMLNYSRIEAGQMVYELAPVPLSAVVDVVLPMVEPQAVNKQLTLEHHPFPEPLIGRADQAKVEQIILNLLSNAVKFTPTGGRIAIGYAVLDSGLGITVQDTGPGIPPDLRDAIFEPFVQVGRRLNNPSEGTGLGLAISRDLARAMGGDVVVESVPGRGSTFTLKLMRA